MAGVPIGNQELGVVFILAVIFLGPRALPVIAVRLGAALRDDRGARARGDGSWTTSDWVLIIAVIGLGLLAAAFAASAK
jgi:hypothetical protein